MLRALQGDILNADDQKIRQIVKMADEASESQIWTTVLEPLRPRLASLRPQRPLRFTRLLLVPLDGLIVPARAWRLGHATIPRSVVKSISETLQIAMGLETETVNRLIAGHNTRDIAVITRAGSVLGRGAGQMRPQAPPPINWATTDLPLSAYTPLARAIATVLRRAAALRRLPVEAETGMVEADQPAMRAILSNMTDEPAEGRVMVFKLILGHSPQASSLFGNLIDASGTSAEKTLLQTAVANATDAVLADLENGLGMAEILREGSLSVVGIQMERINRLMQELGDDPNATRYRPRLQAIGKQLDAICRERFSAGIETGLVAPLTSASAPVDGAAQKQLEECARYLRAAETAGRKLGSAATYDALLAQASETVQKAAEVGSLSPVRMSRLIEILAGSDRAEMLYRQTKAQQSRQQ